MNLGIIGQKINIVKEAKYLFKARATFDAQTAHAFNKTYT